MWAWERGTPASQKNPDKLDIKVDLFHFVAKNIQQVHLSPPELRTVIPNDTLATIMRVNEMNKP